MEEKKKNFKRTFTYILAGICAACALGAVISTLITNKTTVFSTVIWATNALIWILLWIEEHAVRECETERADTLQKAYDKECELFDGMAKIAKEVNDDNVKQNKLCDQAIQDHKETLAKAQKLLDMCKELSNERYDLLKALAKFDPHHPLIEAFIKKAHAKNFLSAQRKNKKEEKLEEPVL